jgi:hypothetical protein
LLDGPPGIGVPASSGLYALSFPRSTECYSGARVGAAESEQIEPATVPWHDTICPSQIRRRAEAIPRGLAR